MTIAAAACMKTHATTVLSDCSVFDAFDVMDLYRETEIYVVDSLRTLIGVVTEERLAAFVFDRLCVQDEPVDQLRSTPVSDFVEPAVMCITDAQIVDVSIIACLLTITRQLPVVDECGVLVGTLNRVDIAQRLLDSSDE